MSAKLRLSGWRRPLIWLLIITSVFIVTIIIAIAFIGEQLMKPNHQTIGALPSDLKGDAIEFSSNSGAMIKGWFVPGQVGKGTVILMHGVRATRESMLARAQFLSQAGYSVMLFDFQAHGDSLGQHITFGYLESRDAQAAVDYLRARVPGEKIAIIGTSMGGAATLLATPPLPVDAIVIEEVYPTIREATDNRLQMRLGRWATVLTPLLLWQMQFRLNIQPDDLRPIDKIGAIKLPKLIIAGSEDQHTTLAQSQALYQAAAEPKELWIVAGAAHVDLHQFDRATYQQRILNFLEKNFKRKD